MKYYKKMIGERIYLSPTNTEDIEIYTKWMNDFNTTDYIGRSFMIIRKEDEKQHFENPSRREQQYNIVTLDNDKLIGTISLDNLDFISRKATLGIFIGDKEYRGKGIGQEAIELILDFGFNYLNLHSINLDVISFNERAHICYLKCGFKECGRKRETEYIDGKYYDILTLDILKEEFNKKAIKNRRK